MMYTSVEQIQWFCPLPRPWQESFLLQRPGRSLILSSRAVVCRNDDAMGRASCELFASPERFLVVGVARVHGSLIFLPSSRVVHYHDHALSDGHFMSLFSSSPGSSLIGLSTCNSWAGLQQMEPSSSYLWQISSSGRTLLGRAQVSLSSSGLHQLPSTSSICSAFFAPAFLARLRLWMKTKTAAAHSTKNATTAPTTIPAMTPPPKPETVDRVVSMLAGSLLGTAVATMPTSSAR